jgi:hypothetical protein
MQLLNSGYKMLEVLIHISLIRCIHHNILLKKILVIIIIIIIYNPKFKKLSISYDYFGTC